MIAQLRNGAVELDNLLGLILSVQIMHDLFIENPSVGDPGYSMVDNTPDMTHIKGYPGSEFASGPKSGGELSLWALELVVPCY
jgi:hypothetical protein